MTSGSASGCERSLPGLCRRRAREGAPGAFPWWVPLVAPEAAAEPRELRAKCAGRSARPAAATRAGWPGSGLRAPGSGLRAPGRQTADSRGQLNQIPQTVWLKIAGVRSLSHSPGGQKPTLRVSGGWVPRGTEGDCSRPLPRPPVATGHPWRPWLGDTALGSVPLSSRGLPPCVRVQVFFQTHQPTLVWLKE